METLVIKSMAVVACVFIVVTGGCEMRRNELKYDAIKAGADPMALSCASGVNTNEEHICTLIAQRGEKK